jgi:hypothetical protein
VAGALHCRPEELDGVDETGNGVARQRQNGCPPDSRQRDGVARLERDSVDEYLADVVEHLRHVVPFADRGAAGSHDDVVVEVPLDCLAERRRVVGHDVPVGDRAAPPLDKLADGLSVGLDDLSGVGVALDEFLARRHDAHRRGVVDLHLCGADGLQQPQIRRTEPVTGLEEGLAVGDVLADRPDVLALRDGREHLEFAPHRLGVLDHHHCVGASREFAAGVDPDCPARFDRVGALGDSQGDRRPVARAERVLRAERVAVHGCPGVVGHRSGAPDCLGDDAPVGLP